MSLRRAVARSEEYLADRGIEDASVDALLLLEYVTGMTRSEYLANREQNMTTEQRDAYAALIRQRGSHIPLQYLTGEQEFMGLPFLVNEQVLIPRQDTETLAEEALKQIASCAKEASCAGEGEPVRVLDLCTGSGCLAVSIAQLIDARVSILASDLSEEALDLARRNADRLLAGPKRERLQFVRSDLFAQIPQSDFDLILSNPPYIRTDVLASLSEEVRLHEPILALDGGADGLKYYRQIIREAGSHLRPGGRLLLEIGYDQAEAVTDLLRQNGFTQIEIKKDLSGNDRVAAGRLEDKNV